GRSHCALIFVFVGRIGPNAYIRRLFHTCWRTKGVCKRSCGTGEIFHIFCEVAVLCCIDKKYLPVMVGK
uniref:Beta-defensin n=1 Tax=Phocoena sinus TaxID=42100 RepID=A0A8C9CGA5_PHOSS